MLLAGRRQVLLPWRLLSAMSEGLPGLALSGCPALVGRGAPPAGFMRESLTGGALSSGARPRDLSSLASARQRSGSPRASCGPRGPTAAPRDFRPGRGAPPGARREARRGTLIDGLLQRFSDGVIPATAMQGLMRDVLAAVGHLHRHGVLHRDIKPDNMVWHSSEASGDDRVMLIDFDLAEPNFDPTGAEISLHRLGWVGTARRPRAALADGRGGIVTPKRGSLLLWRNTLRHQPCAMARDWYIDPQIEQSAGLTDRILTEHRPTSEGERARASE